MTRIIAALLLAALLSTAALSHSWYDASCCSGDDCAPLPDGSVEERADGYFLKATGELIPREKAKQGRDEDYHLCRSKVTGHIYCIYTPDKGS